ncbi:hypothetical protein As57867_010257, partial [Aphanomyces stellatus]
MQAVAAFVALTLAVGVHGQTCDQALTAANNQLVAVNCSNLLPPPSSASPPSFAAIAVDVLARGNSSLFVPGLCGIPACQANLNAFLTAYPTCTPMIASSYLAPLNVLNATCVTLLTSQSSQPAFVTCQVEDMADYIWATTQVMIPPNCAVAIGSSPSTLWYTVHKTLTLSSSNAITSAYCGSPDCVALIRSIQRTMNNCTFEKGVNLFAEATNLIEYCAANPNPYGNGTCDFSITAANQVDWSPACAADLSAGPPPTVAAVAVDFAANPGGVFALGICGSANCATQLNSIISSYPTCTAVSATSYLTALTNLKISCTGVVTGTAPTSSTCASLDKAYYTFAKYQVRLTPNCAAALASFSFTASSLWYSVLQSMTLSSSNQLTSTFCRTPACTQLTIDTCNGLSNCTNMPTGENLYTASVNLLAYCGLVNKTTPRQVITLPTTTTTVSPTSIPTSAPYSGQSCDFSIRAANAITLTCALSLPGQPAPSLAAIAVDYMSNSNSGFGYGICGSPTCRSSLISIITAYPQCTPVMATSYYATLSTMSTACPSLLTSFATGTNTCMLADYVNLNWAKTKVTLTPNCAADLAMYGYATTSLWYTVVQAAGLRQSNVLTASFCASSDCIQLTQATQSWLPQCTDSSGGNVFVAADSLLAYCKTMPVPFPLSSCDQMLTTANQWTLSPSCAAAMQSSSSPSLGAIAIDHNTNSWAPEYAYAICGFPACTVSFNTLLASYPTCSPFSFQFVNTITYSNTYTYTYWQYANPTSHYLTLTNIKNACANYAALTPATVNACAVSDYAKYNWAKTKVKLTPVCAADLSKMYSYWYWYNVYSTNTLWYSVVQGLSLSPYNSLTSYFCGSLDCIQLTINTASWLSNCNSNSGENLYATATNLLAYCVAQNPLITNTTLVHPIITPSSLLPLNTPNQPLPQSQSCDQSITAINQQLLTGSCPAPGFALPPTLAAIAIDFDTNPVSSIGYAICGSPSCLSSLSSYVASYPQCTPSIATSYYSTLNNVLSTCPRILSAIATGANTCMLADYANYNWAKRALTLSPNCAAALAPFGFTTTTLWYSIIQAATLTESNMLASAVCGSADCVQLAKSTQSMLTNCLTSSGENLFATMANLTSYCASSPPPPFPPYSCNQQIQTANQMTLSQSCTSAIGSLTYSSSSPPTLAAIGMDYTKNPNSIYGYAICGIPACVASLTTFLASYPTCTPFPVSYWIGPKRTFIFPTSFLSTITTLNQNTCVNIASSIPGSNNTCQVADYATYKWAKFQVSLTPNCAAALSNFGYTSTSLWYSALQGATSTKLTTLAFCGSPDCIQLTTNMVSTLSNCSVASGENLFATATALVANCAVLRTLALAPPAIAVTTLTPSPNSTTFAPTATPVVRTCDQLMTTANQWTLDDTCMSTFQGITATSTLAAIAIDFATNTNSIFGYSICGIPSCTSSLKRLLATYPRCTPVVATSYVGSLTSILNACPRLLNTVATTSNTCMLADYATYTWAKFQVTLTPNCAGDLSIFGYTGASSWYTVVRAAKLDLTNALTASFCGSSDCLALTNTTVAKLPNCKVASGDNLYSTTKSLLAFCPSTSNPYPDESCDQLLTTANQWLLGPSCNRSTGLLLQPPSLAAVAIDYSNNPNSIFGFGICGDPACTASLTASLASYPTCSAFPAYYWSANSWAVVQPVSYASQLTTLLGSCAEYK